jgi:tetratricopeptide (TPR) repeat protein
MKLLTFQMFAGLLIGAPIISAQQPPAALSDVTPMSFGSRFAKETAYPYYTSDPYGRQPGVSFPDDPADYYLRRKVALAMAHRGECADAVPRLSALVREFGDDSELWAELGLCESAIGGREAAIASLETALELGAGPFDGNFETIPAEIMVEIGWLHAGLGDVEEALSWLRRGLEARYTWRPQMASMVEAAGLIGNPGFDALAGLAPDGEWTRDERWRYDIAFLGEQVALLHFDADHHTPAAELERFLQELSDAVPELSNEQILARLTLFMGRLGAGHDVILSVPEETGTMMAFALRAYFFTDGLYIIEAQDESLVGARVEAFGATPTTKAFEIVANAIARDNNMTALWSAPRHLMSPVMLEALGIIEDAEAAGLTITDRRGNRRVISPAMDVPVPGSPALAPPPNGEAPLYLSRLRTPYWTARLEESEALYVQINGIFDAPDEDFATFADRVGREAADPGVRHLILDLRHNLGGNGYLAALMLRTLVHFDMEPDKGQLYVLIGRNTFSAAQSFITHLEPLTDALFVGEPSGSRPNFIGRTGQFSLPFSQVSGYISSEYSQNSYAEDHRIWTAPDVPVGLSSEDFFAGRDPALDAIAELIGAASN